MQFDAAMQSFSVLYKQFAPLLDSLLLLFFRILAFMVTGPIFNRKNIPILFKISIAIFITSTLFWMLAPERRILPAGYDAHFLVLPLVMNIVIGTTMGFIGDLLFQAVAAAGGFMNNQIGLSSAAMMDPSSGRQTMILETLFNYIGALLFIHIGGIQWMIIALRRSVEIMPLAVTQIDLPKIISMPYLIEVSGNVMKVGVELIAPVMIVTIAMDVMLGVVNRTAQQIPVFQLSFALKPCVGIAITMLTMTTFIQAVSNYFNDYSRLF